MKSLTFISLWVTKDMGGILGLFVGLLACLLVYEFLFHYVHVENGCYEGRVFVSQGVHCTKHVRVYMSAHKGY